MPKECWLAAFPQPRAAGNAELLPLTLGGAAALGRLGIRLDRRVPRERAVEAAWVLASGGRPGGRDALRRFCRVTRCGLSELSAAVEAALDDAFATYLPPDPGRGGTRHLTPHGLGWPLETAEWLCAEYGWGWAEALDTPCATAFAMAAACRQRRGGRHAGLDYMERQYAADLKAGRAAPLEL